MKGLREVQFLENNGKRERVGEEETGKEDGEKNDEDSQTKIAALNRSGKCILRFGETDCPSFVLQSRNEKGQDEHDGDGGTSIIQRRRNYHKFSAEERSHIGMLASEMGTTRAIRQLKREYPGLKLAESTVRGFKNMYLQERQRREKDSSGPKSKKRVRGRYQTYSEKDRAKIGKYAHANGNANAIRYFKEFYPGISESTVRGFKNMYTKELARVTEETKTGSTLQESVVTNGTTMADEFNDQSGRQEIQFALAQSSPLPQPQHPQLPTPEPQISTQYMVPRKLVEIESLPRQKRGRPGKIPSRIEALIITYLGAIAEKDIKLLTHQAVIAIAKGVIIVEDR